MITSLEIDGFRGFRKLKAEGFRRVNVIVGKNSSGKTSLLEAIEIAQTGSEQRLIARLQERGEVVAQRIEASKLELRATVRPCFYRHEIADGSSFEIGAAFSARERMKVTATLGEGADLGTRGLQWDTGSEHTGILLDAQYAVTFVQGPVNEYNVARISVVTAQTAVDAWDAVAVKAAEPRVLAALRIVEADVEQVGARGGLAPRVYVRFRGETEPVHLASLGDGAVRLFVLGCKLAQCADGVLLVDEIETGLHHSTMSKMWSLVVGAARELNVQVFATTHSLDCLRGLDNYLKFAPERGEDVAVHRVEAGGERLVTYSADLLHAAMASEIEVR